MEVHPFAYTSDAPVDPHTEALLATFAPKSVELPAQASPHMVLRSWAAMASRSDDRLVIVDSRFRCERNAIANLVDDPRVSNAVLLAHSDAGGVNSFVQVNSEGFLADEGVRLPTAGLLVVAPAQLPAFTDGLYRAAAAAAASDEPVDPWNVAVAVLTDITDVQAVVAAPFCASRVAMDLPQRSEDDRRLRAAGSPADIWVTTTLVRPVTRWATKQATVRSWRPGKILIGALATAAIAPLSLALLPGRIAELLAALLILTSTVLFLTSAQLVRYQRRPSTQGAFRYRQAHRWADVLILSGLGIAAASASPNGWVWAAAALAAAVLADSIALTSRSVGSTHSRQWWVLRWLAAALTLVVAGALAALIVSVAVALLGTTTTVIAHARDGERTLLPVSREQRFLVAPGALLDAGVLLRALSNTRVPLPAVHPGLVTTAAVSLVAAGVAISWGRGGWVLFFAAVSAIAAFAWVCARPTQGVGAWAMPGVVTATEMAVLLAVAAALPVSGQVAIPLVVGAILLINGVVADRWQLLQRAPQPWLPVADFGFDGRMLLAAVALLIGSAFASTFLLVLAVWLVLLWLAAFTASQRTLTRERGAAATPLEGEVRAQPSGLRSLKA